MKEVWLTKGSPKWMPFHLIFFKNADRFPVKWRKILDNLDNPY